MRPIEWMATIVFVLNIGLAVTNDNWTAFLGWSVALMLGIGGWAEFVDEEDEDDGN